MNPKIKNIFWGLMILMTVLVSTSLADTFKQYQFVDELGLPRTDATYVYVYNAGTATASTIYQGNNRQTAITNPLTPSSTNTTLTTYDGSFYFFDKVLNHDIVANVGGVKVKFENVTPQDKRLVVPRAVYPAFIQKKGGFCTFNSTPVCVQSDGTAASGTNTEVNIWSINGVNFECINIGTQTITTPVQVATGLDVTRDVDAADSGWEITQGILASGPAAFTVGTDGPFHFKCRLTITDVSGSDDLLIGFRKAEAYQAAVDNYDEMAAFNINGKGTEPTTQIIQTETILNNATTVTTPLTTSTWTDTATKTLEIYVALDGAVTYKIDGASPAEAVAFSFDSGEVVIPFFYMIHDTDYAESTILQVWDCGLDAN